MLHELTGYSAKPNGVVSLQAVNLFWSLVRAEVNEGQVNY